MRLLNFSLKNNTQEITFVREYIEESGKMNCQYALWEGKQGELTFGIVNPQNKEFSGFRVAQNKREIIDHLQNAIGSRKIRVNYHYIPAPAEDTGYGVIQEILPSTISHFIDVSEELRGYLIEMVKIIENTRG